MAAASYAHDLTDLVADADTTAWTELTGKLKAAIDAATDASNDALAAAIALMLMLDDDDT